MADGKRAPRFAPRFATPGLVAVLALAMSACGGGAARPAGLAKAQTPASSAPVASKPAAVAPTPSPTAAAPAPRSIVVGMLTPDAFYWPDFVAQDEGFFKRNGVNVQVTHLRTPAVAAAALVGGSINVAEASSDAFIEAIERGAQVAIVGQIIGNPVFAVVTQPHVTSWKALSGGSIAVSNPKAGAAIVFQLMAKANGLKSYSFRSVGTTPTRVAALAANQVTGAILSEPEDIRVLDKGYHLLQRSDQVLPHFSFIVAATQLPWGQAHRDTLVRYLRALGQAVSWIYDPANHQAALQVLKAHAKFSSAELQRAYQIYVQEGQGRVLSRGAQVDMAGLTIYGDAMARLGIIKPPVDPKKWVDLSFEKAATSGQ